VVISFLPVKQKEVLQKRRKIAAALPGSQEVLWGSLLERTVDFVNVGLIEIMAYCPNIQPSKCSMT
jgi:hypothetical protein